MNDRLFEPPKRRRIFLMRHGEAAYVADDGSVTTDPRNVTLTAAGRIQARKQAAVLASVAFDKAVCSGMPRTMETAKLILAYREHPELEIQPALEEIHGGGAPAASQDIGAWLRHVANPWAAADEPAAQYLGGERFDDFAARITPAFDAIITDQSWQTLLLVLHGAVNRMLFNHIMGTPWRANASIEQDNCCINIIDVDSQGDGEPPRFLIRGVNLTAYDLNKSSAFLTNMEQAAQRIAENIENHAKQAKDA
jgi:broad specificity phosphatase PhoE